jgi:hypothetical protein
MQSFRWVCGVLSAALAGLAVTAAVSAAPRHKTVDWWADKVDFGNRPSINGWSHYHRHGHRRQIEVKLYHAGQLRDKTVRIFVKGKGHIGTVRARHKKIHLQIDTTHGDFVPRVHYGTHLEVRLKHRTYPNSDRHVSIAVGAYYCKNRHCRA